MSRIANMFTRHFFTVFLFIFSLLFVSSVFAYTTPGSGVTWTGDDLVTNSDGAVTWDEANSRYQLNEQIIISPSDQVNIYSSIHSLYDDVDDIEVQGSLYIMPEDSTVTDSILVTGDYETDGPGGVRVVEGGYLYIEQAIMIGLPEGHDQAVRNFEGDMDIVGCRFAEWERYAINISGGATGTIDNCILHDNQQWTINISTGSTVNISNCTFLNNNLGSPTSAKNPISIGAQGANTVYVDNCYINGQDGNAHGGVSVWNIDGAASYVEVRNTTVENASFGVILNGENVSGLITDCIFHNNTAGTNPMVTGSGVTIQYGAEGTIARCDITGNYWGVTTYSGNSTANLGDWDAEDPDEQGFNLIYDNGNGGSVYNFYNNTSLPQTAQNNWWGSDDPEVVEQTIFHNPDNGSLGLVTYLPIWVPGSGPEITSYSPEELSPGVTFGETIDFSFEAEHPQGLNMDFSLLHNGELVSDTNSVSIEILADSSTVTARVVDENGEEDTVTWTMLVTNYPPEITSYTPTDISFQCFVDDNLYFALVVFDPDEDDLEYEWMLDDEFQSSEPDFTYSPSELDTFTVSCTVSDPYGASDSISWQVYVVDGLDENDQLPFEYSLNTYPNPFNPTLSVNYSVPETSELSIKIYSINGREVTNLYNGKIEAGRFSLTWNASDLSSGTYFVKMNAGEFNTVRRVLLIK